MPRVLKTDIQVWRKVSATTTIEHMLSPPGPGMQRLCERSHSQKLIWRKLPKTKRKERYARGLSNSCRTEPCRKEPVYQTTVLGHCRRRLDIGFCPGHHKIPIVLVQRESIRLSETPPRVRKVLCSSRESPEKHVVHIQPTSYSESLAAAAQTIVDATCCDNTYKICQPHRIAATDSDDSVFRRSFSVQNRVVEIQPTILCTVWGKMGIMHRTMFFLSIIILKTTVFKNRREMLYLRSE